MYCFSIVLSFFSLSFFFFFYFLFIIIFLFFSMAFTILRFSLFFRLPLFLFRAICVSVRLLFVCSAVPYPSVTSLRFVCPMPQLYPCVCFCFRCRHRRYCDNVDQTPHYVWGCKYRSWHGVEG